MTDATTERDGQHLRVPAPVGRGFVTRYALAYVGFYLVSATPLVVTLALKVDDVVSEDDKAFALGLVVGLGALASMVTYPLAGRLSDRTRSSWGMRRPWIAGGSLGLIGASVLVAVAPDLPTVVLSFCLFQALLSAMAAAMTAVLPDQVPVHQRGTVSGVLGIATPVGLVGGAGLVAAVHDQLVLAYLLPAVIATACLVPLLVTLPDRRLAADVTLPPWSLREVAGSLWVDPRRVPDFGYAWLGRFLFGLATSILTTYLVFYLEHRHGLTEDQATDRIALAIGLMALVALVSSVVGGRLSDRSGRRKRFVVVAAAIYGIGTLMVAATTSMSVFLVAMLVSGLGLGTYLAVDLALVADVLPDPDAAGKDMGVFNMASTLPQTVAPLLAAVVLVASGESYPLLYAVAALCGAGAALVTLKIRGVR